MNIKEIKYSHRNDFKAIFVCPKCGQEFEAWGYSDANYSFNKVMAALNNAMPNAICPKCGLNSYGETMEQLKTRVGREYVI